MSSGKKPRKFVYHDRPVAPKKTRRADSPRGELYTHVLAILEKYKRRKIDPAFDAQCKAEEAAYDAKCVSILGKKVHPSEIAKQYESWLAQLVRARKEHRDAIFIDAVKFAKEAYLAGVDLGGSETEIGQQLLNAYGTAGKKRAKQLLLVYWKELLSEFVFK